MRRCSRGRAGLREHREGQLDRAKLYRTTGEIMRSMLRRALVGTASLALTLAVAPFTPLTQASADQGDTLKGGCGFVTVNVPLLFNGVNEGVIFVSALSQEASGTQSTA